MYKKFLFILIIIIALTLLFSNSVSASSFGDGLNKTAQGVQDLDQERTLVDYIAFATQSLLTLIGIVFVVILIYGGFLYMTAAGNDDKISKSKKAMASAAVGVLLIGAGQIITITIVSLIEQPGEGVQQPFDEECLDPYDANYFSIRCCEYRAQANRGVLKECCDQNTFYNAHSAECDVNAAGNGS